MTRNNFQHQRIAIRRIKWQFEDKTMSISDKKGLNFDRNKTILLKIFVLNPINMKNLLACQLLHLHCPKQILEHFPRDLIG